jgi:hypothetical protein
MTDQELKDLVASLAVQSKETDRIVKENAIQLKETDRIIRETADMQKETANMQKETANMQKETDRQMKETDRQMKETDRRMQLADCRLEKLEKRLEKIGIQVGGINDNIGFHAEQFFQDVFEEKLEFGRMKYNEMIPNLTYKGRNEIIEFDIALLNGDSIALIEVKNRIHPNFVKILAEERVEKFRKYFLEFSDYDIYLGIAGFSFSDEVLDQASRYGIGIIKQVGTGVEIEANNLKAY